MRMTRQNSEYLSHRGCDEFNGAQVRELGNRLVSLVARTEKNIVMNGDVLLVSGTNESFEGVDWVGLSLWSQNGEKGKDFPQVGENFIRVEYPVDLGRIFSGMDLPPFFLPKGWQGRGFVMGPVRKLRGFDESGRPLFYGMEEETTSPTEEL